MASARDKASPEAESASFRESPDHGAESPEKLSQSRSGSEGLDEAEALKNLTEDVRDQDDLERDITKQAKAALDDAEDSRDLGRIEKMNASKARLAGQKEAEKKKLDQVGGNPYQAGKIREEILKLDIRMKEVDEEIAHFEERIARRNRVEAADETHPKGHSGKLAGESHRDYLLRTGKITPFTSVGGPRPEGTEGELADIVYGAEEEAVAGVLDQDEDGYRSHRLLRTPGFKEHSPHSTPRSGSPARPRKKRRLVKSDSSSDDYDPRKHASPVAITSGDSESEAEERPRKRKGGKAQATASSKKIDISKIDDGDERMYRKRLGDWITRRSRARRRRLRAQGLPDEEDDNVEEFLKPAPDSPSMQINAGLKMPGDIHPSLFGYQKTGVQWLAELHDQKIGGIVADEMGLGKTVQIISFLAAIHHSGKFGKPTIVVAPATLLQQWVNEFHRWWPPFRVSILHASGSGMMNLANEFDNELDHEVDRTQRKSIQAAQKIVSRVKKFGHVLVTTYTGLQMYAEELLSVGWGYAILDEGHKIRNPNADITVVCKELQTPHRIILSGTPVQNNLSELWSLFDFIYPMRLGTLVNFKREFEFPIKQGGYANASTLQIMTAEKCAETLKDTISKYLLQRLKIDVAADLPQKTEQVLFCKLTPAQRQAYEMFLRSDDANAIIAGKRESLAGIDILRKICNHPDLLNPKKKLNTSYNWADPEKSGKLKVVHSLLKINKKFGHKTLLFSQSKIMLNIIESFLAKHLPDIKYFRMDGETPVATRQVMIDQFNGDPDIHVFLLTTKTGGLGVNLTGADRIIIFDPDWNPSTDMQARERAWRLGQTKPVSIFRLMTSGTIEEKIYRRQIFKQFIASKVLQDPKQRTNFDLADLYDLFTSPPSDEGPRGQMFENAKIDIGKDGDGPGKKQVTGGQDSGENGQGQEDAQLQSMENVANAEDFVEDEEKKLNDEKRMMQGIFTRSVESAYEHEQIIGANGKKKVQADRGMLLEEARRVAAGAAAHLRRSEQQARTVTPGIVTFTGIVGQELPSMAHRPAGGASRRGGGPSGGSVLGGPAAAENPARYMNLRTRDYAEMITKFINHHNDKVPTKMIVDHFGPMCPTNRHSRDFKTALNRVAAISHPGAAGRGIWSLTKSKK